MKITFSPGDRVRLNTTTGPIDGTVAEPPEIDNLAPGGLIWVIWDDNIDSWAGEDCLEKL